MNTNNTQTQGAITEQRCFLKCLEYGFGVSKPLFDNARYDFTLHTGKTLLKMQIKITLISSLKAELILECQDNLLLIVQRYMKVVLLKHII